MDWSTLYPALIAEEAGSPEEMVPIDGVLSKRQRLAKDVTVADIGCGFGGLLVALGPKLPDELLLGIMN